MTKKQVFLALSLALLIAVAVATIQDVGNRQYLAVQQRYAKDYNTTLDAQVQQLFPAFAAAQRGDTYRVERCISCHVPDIATIGPQQAAKHLSQDFFKYDPNAQTLAQQYHLTGTHPALIDSQLYGQYGAGAYASPDGFTPYTIPGANGTTQAVKLPGFIPSFLDPSANKGTPFGIDSAGCIVCHNGNRLALTQTDAHQNLIVNPEYSWSAGAALYYKECVACHGAQGEGGVGPPLNNQDRLGFFNEDYYYRCIEWGFTDFEHYSSVMPNWGSVDPQFTYDPTLGSHQGRDKQKPSTQRVLSEQQIQTLIEFIRHWENYSTLP
jgi:mono/diheme cytochrome c family protein